MPGAVKRMPDADVISKYAAKATVIAYAATCEKFVLGPGYSSFGTADPNGLYVINTSNANLTIRNCRIYGTLVVLAGSGTVTVDDSCVASQLPVRLSRAAGVRQCDHQKHQRHHAALGSRPIR